MIREKLKYQDQFNLLTDILTVFVSYLLAVILRYKVMRSEPGLDTLSAPYLLVAFCYSIIISIIFQYTRNLDIQEGRIGTRNIGINAVGCLFFLGFFYVIGEFYFSRIALVFFWLISSCLLEIKWSLIACLFNKVYARKTEKRRVLLVGGGEVMDQYIRAYKWNNACSFKLIGYVGKAYGIFYDDIFEVEDSEKDATKRGNVGNFDHFEEALDKYCPDEVVFALQEEEVHRLSNYIPVVNERGIPSCLVPDYIRYLPGQSSMEGSVNTVAVDLEKHGEKRSYGINLPGAAITVVFLILMLVIDRFGMGNVDGLELYDSYRAFIFGILGYFVYQSLSVRLEGIPHARSKIALFSILVLSVLICIYEPVYTHGVRTRWNIMSDVLMTVGVVSLCSLMQIMKSIFEGSNIWTYFS